MPQITKAPKGVRLQNVTKIYNDPKTKKNFAAVDDVSLDIKVGSFVTLLGPSGCGKTTILRMISGFESPDKGEIYLGNKPINSLPPNKRDTAMVFQSYALLPNYNVYDNIAYGLKIRKLPKPQIQQMVLDILDLVELQGLEERQTNQLSGGQQQRVALARALVMQPGVLLFDEPLSNLDAKLRVTMRTEIRKIQKKLGITAIYVTHDQAEAMSLSDQIILMNKGKIVQQGTPQELYYTPNCPFAADFIGEVNFLPGAVISIEGGEATVSVCGTTIKQPAHEALQEGGECKVVLRPESITLEDKGKIKCKVLVSTFMGAYHYYQAKTDEVIVKVTEYNPKSHHIYEAGDEAWLSFDEKDLHIL